MKKQKSKSEVAPKGFVWVCFMCGKRSKDNFGNNPIDRGWDVSCMMNSQMFEESKLVFGENGRVASIKE